MKLTEKLSYLYENYMGKWIQARGIVEDELSSKQSMFCLCGRLATGIHERSCSKFNNKVTSEAVKRLNYLIVKKEKE